MAKTARRRAAGRRGSGAGATGPVALFREIALQLPNVEDATTDRGIAFKAAGRLVACSAIHKSAEPNSVVIRIGAEQRARLMAAYPDALYLTDHYAKHAAVLARLERLDRGALRDILGTAWAFVTEMSARPSRSRRSKR